MKNATIATSRTRADSKQHFIDYRPIESAWGDAEALRALRTTKARRAAATGTDPELIEMSAPQRPAPRSRRHLRTAHPIQRVASWLSGHRISAAV